MALSADAIGEGFDGAVEAFNDHDQQPAGNQDGTFEVGLAEPESEGDDKEEHDAFLAEGRFAGDRAETFKGINCSAAEVISVMKKQAGERVHMFS